MERLQEFEESLTGGFAHGVLHELEHEENGTELVMFLMDAEYDPVRLTFHSDGDVSIHADGHMYHMFTADQLRFIAKMTKTAEKMWAEIFRKEENA